MLLIAIIFIILLTYMFADDSAMEFLSGLTTSGIDFELHSIPNTADSAYFIHVLNFFRHQLLTNARFELVQACILFYNQILIL